MAEGKEELNEVKRKYEEVKNKYNLPSFEEMNREFTIEDIAEHSYTELFAKRLRISIIEKIMNVLRILEPILNPANAPIFIHTICKNLDSDSSKIIEELYKECCSIEIKSLILSMNPSGEEEEIKLIKESIEKWKEMKPKIKQLNECISMAWKKDSVKSDKSYLG